MPEQSTTAAADPFEAQRRALESARRLSRESVDVQRRAVRAMRNSMPAQRDARRETAALADAMVESAFVAARTTAPASRPAVDELERAFRDGRQSATAASDQWWSVQTAVLSEVVADFDRTADAYAALVDAAFEFALEANARLAENADRYAERSDRVVDIPVEDRR